MAKVVVPLVTNYEAGVGNIFFCQRGLEEDENDGTRTFQVNWFNWQSGWNLMSERICNQKISLRFSRRSTLKYSIEV